MAKLHGNTYISPRRDMAARESLDRARVQAYHPGERMDEMGMNLAALRVNATPALEELWVGEVRELTPADIVMISEEGRGASRAEIAAGPNALKRLSERHHTLARLLATGTSQVHAAVITGYHKGTINLLMNDPSFQELLEFYSQEVNAEYLTMNAQLAGLGADAIAELRKRVEDEPDKLGANFLLEVVTKIADRTGNGPTSTQKVEGHIVLDLAEKMKAARTRARAAIEGTAIDITPEPQA